MNNIYEEKNEYGNITISDSVIANIIIEEIAKYNGRVLITNSKGKSVSRLYKTMGGSPATNIETVIDENGLLSIKFYIVLKFGMSIKHSTEYIIDDIAKEIELATGKLPKKITVVVSGVLSKRLARRNIEVERVYEPK